MFKVFIHGCRGSFPATGSRFQKFGGNTSCVEVRCGNETIVIDAGTGIVNCGINLTADQRTNIRLLFSHVHWDHIQGFPFFSAAFMPSSSIDIFCGHLYDAKGGIKRVLESQMSFPVFPVSMPEVMAANMTFSDFRHGEAITFDGVRVITAPLNHPQKATGYRIEYKGKVFAYVTDTEHVIGQEDENVKKLLDNADYAIYDATYDDEDFEARIGWGHSTWQEGIRLARACGVKKLGLFHHEPNRNDKALTLRDSMIKNVWPKASHNYDGEVVELIKSVQAVS